MGEVKYLFIYLYPFWELTGQTSQQIFTLVGSNDMHSRKDVPFGGVVNIVSHLKGQITPKPQFWGMNRHFQANCAKY